MNLFSGLPAISRNRSKIGYRCSTGHMAAVYITCSTSSLLSDDVGIVPPSFLQICSRTSKFVFSMPFLLASSAILLNTESRLADFINLYSLLTPPVPTAAPAPPSIGWAYGLNIEPSLLPTL
ncbi:hypothetical protein AX774_g4103 [Zancudomyces culisetae]|uniref:Uncharacterized protein n=1 Tax=Zancudomyces culisetae TaxID=1213189 RepID=A0A1R1PNA0_ZANCU|nr:hypothetical protein AX774_g4103 [Zancudomyces culisetae]|eukprot:OMH82411.1 hypothetical protein AX774_g4103 [Zancudomyces culisetae]